ncbi:restriction endonuclease subunit S [Mycoplasmopsis mucosicanis]|uniref:Restriction endonuclease subunit S n=1 Tax=Mycoplasmopsis mucosicanis TaxID=458208 RepID=A0A507SHV8_9BACT|nr:restriction endonuclease subunit S [Mycoplasmopsis mucosicanis]TQC51347.1 restriction endonuclease subunit S [Mycoplasmopsis mucosicanis]
MTKVKNNKIIGKQLLSKDLVNVQTGKEDANFAVKNGKYKFFTCSNEHLNCNEYKFNSSSIIIAGNGDFNVKHYSGKFNAYQRTYVLTPQKDYYAILYLSCVDSIDRFKSKSSGSIVKFITKNDIESIPVFIPYDKNILNRFNKLLTLKENNTMENEYLISLRDFLLPLLMNGQATIKLIQ